MFETTELQILVGVMQGQTLTQIGEQLVLSHPSISRILRAAEQKAGVRLVEPRGRRLALTADGLRIAVTAQESLAKLREMDGLVADIRSGEAGALRILATSTICNYVLGPVIGGLLQHSQNLDIQIQGAENDRDIWSAFETGDYEVAIDLNRPPPHIDATHLFDDQLCLCVAANSPLAQEPVDWPALSAHILIGPLDAEQMWGQFSLVGIQPRSRIQVSSVTLAKRLVEDGHAVAILYRSVAMEEAAAGRLTMLELPDAPLSISYWMATRGSGAGSPLVERFSKLIRGHVRRI
jgi:DNA-binding transcriptional LysR family regulator